VPASADTVAGIRAVSIRIEDRRIARLRRTIGAARVHVPCRRVHASAGRRLRAIRR
jgi:hypothetical protein